jgi:hypothetical protein
MYGIMQKNWVNTFIPFGTYFILIYTLAFLDAESRERVRERELAKIRTSVEDE